MFQSFLNRLNFRQGAAARRIKARDTDIVLSNEIIAVSRAEVAGIWPLLRASPEGLEPTEAATRLAAVGPNLITREGRPSVLRELWGRAKNPLNALLLSLATVSYFLGDIRAAVVIAIMVVLAIATAFIQEHRSNDAAAKLRAMVKTAASVKRRGASHAAGEDQSNGFIDLPMEQLVPGDIVRLSAGDMIPADLRLVEAKNLRTEEASLTGESVPADKTILNGRPHVELVNHADKKNLGLSATQQTVGQWNTDSVLNPDELNLMRCAYQRAVGSEGPECEALLAAFFAHSKDRLEALRPGWYGVGRRKDVAEPHWHAAAAFFTRLQALRIRVLISERAVL